MNSKRIKFALFICVFVLYGCTSSSTILQGTLNTDSNKTRTSNDVIYTSTVIQPVNMLSDLTQMMPIEKEESVVVELDTGIKLELDMDTYAKKMKTKIKQERERLGKQLKAEEEKARLKELEETTTETFQPRITTYGVDCYGCGGESGSGNTAFGVKLDTSMGVLMPDGSWQQGIKYGNYYIVAADPSIPFCSILKISNHGLSGSGISPNEPYYAIVLDRGGAIQGSHLDLYIGSESSNAIIPVQQTQANAQILRYGGQSGARSCAL